MTKQITPEIIERAIEFLVKDVYCCHALASALGGWTDNDWELVEELVESFMYPLLERDNISKDGYWTYAVSDVHAQAFPIQRRDWLRKIAQELREGKI